MKIRKLGSATVLITVGETTVLCDPWLTDGAYYGSWCNFPPIELNKVDLSCVDYVYVSHIHPDHFDPKTMELIDKRVPVLIHRYHQGFLRGAIERLGFRVIELENGNSFSIGYDASISIFAADDCDPLICGQMFGCITSEIKGSMQIDSLCVISDGKQVLVNTNDCPYGISSQTIRRIKGLFPEIDMALVGYTSASLYPHCMMDYTSSQMRDGIDRAMNIGLNSGLNTIRDLNPKFFMPFAGTYILGGTRSSKNKDLPIPEIQDAAAFFECDEIVAAAGSRAVLLNFNEEFDLESGMATAGYEEIDAGARDEYIASVASKFAYTFESERIPSNSELLDLFSSALPRLRRKQKSVGLQEDINLVFDVNDGCYVQISLLGDQPLLTTNFDHSVAYHRFKLDARLLRLALMGPKFANWNNIEIGALLDFSRNPDTYRMDIHILINSLHV